jgi:putative NADH-flavin reductase
VVQLHPLQLLDGGRQLDLSGGQPHQSLQRALAVLLKKQEGRVPLAVGGASSLQLQGGALAMSALYPL